MPQIYQKGRGERTEEKKSQECGMFLFKNEGGKNLMVSHLDLGERGVLKVKKQGLVAMIE